MKLTTVSLALAAALFSLNAVAGNAANGEALTKKYNCASCHGADFKSPVDPGYPKLAGQHEDYLVHALTAYKRGDAANGRNNPIMSGMAKPLSDQDVKDIAAYLHGLGGTFVQHR
jgi:cytochrome c553